MEARANPSSALQKLSAAIDIPLPRLKFIQTVAPEETKPLLDHFAAKKPKNSISSDSTLQQHVERARYANELARATSENADLTRALLSDDKIASLRDIALKYDNQALKQILPQATLHAQAAAASVEETPNDSQPLPEELSNFQDVIFNAETSAFIQRMLQDGEFEFAKKSVALPSQARLNVDIARAVAATPSSRSPDQDPIQSGMIQVLKNKPDFHFRKHAISSLLNDESSFTQVPEEDRPAVADGLKTIALAQSLTSTSKALPSLVKSKLSAFKVAQLPEAQFVESFGADVGGEDIAKAIHNQAIQVTTRNDHALTSILQTVRGTGIAAIDGPELSKERQLRLAKEANDRPEQINLEKLFGALDYCECSDCTSVTSPAAYFVELLQFLRNNNLNPNTPWSRWNDIEDFRHSPLDHLFRRRPDLACLELTCANTNTVLPYIDLANEVMESFIYHQQRYIDSNPRQAWIDIFNASENADGLGGSTQELLAVPQNVNMEAYLILHQSVYPAKSLPYHQPIDAIRQFLGFLGTSRAEVLRIFQARYVPPTKVRPNTWGEITCPPPKAKTPKPCPNERSDDECTSTDPGDGCCNDIVDDETQSDADPDGFEGDDEDFYAGGISPSTDLISPDDQTRLADIHQAAIRKAVAAEEVGITQDEYIILTKQAFWPKSHFDIMHGEEATVPTYRRNIGVKKDWEYWGVDYTSETDMLDKLEGKGLTYVKDQFLPRTGIQYSDLVDMLRTNYINPHMPKGRSKVILESLRFSYQFLASKINKQEKRRMARLQPLLQFLEHPVDDQESGFQEVFQNSLKKQRCCQLLFENRTRRRPQLLEADSRPESSKDQRKHNASKCACGCDKELREWICKYFESVGRIIVLDSGEGQKLPWEGDIIAYDEVPDLRRVPAISGSLTTSRELQEGEILVGHIHKDGSITQSAESSFIIGYVALDGVVYDVNGNPLTESWPRKNLKVVRTDEPTDEEYDGWISLTDSTLHIVGMDTPTPWTITYDDCDLTKVRLQHLDGKSVTRFEYDRMHRFLRLWRKLNWTIPEVDAAVSAFGGGPKSQGPPTTPDPSTPAEDDDVDYDDFHQDCGCGLPSCSECSSSSSSKAARRAPPKQGKYCPNCGRLKCVKGSKRTNKNCNCKPEKPKKGGPEPTGQRSLDISPYLIDQIASVKKIADLVGLSILQLLALWTNIDTHGNRSLYAQLFLTHNMMGINRVFVPDADGNYLVQTPQPKISEHRPILLAAFGLKPQDLDDIIRIAPISDDPLTLESVSAIYRHSTIAKMLGVKPKDLDLIFKVFWRPWESADKTLKLIKLWNKVTDAGFDIKQFAFVFKNIDEDPLQPIGPSEASVSRLAASIYTALKDIESQHPMVTTADDATSATVTTKAQLIFPQATVTDMIAFLEGTRLYSTNAPTIANPTIPENLSSKLKYIQGDSPSVQSIGQLTAAEVGQAKAVAPANTKWVAAIDRLFKQALTFFNTVLSPIFTDKDEAKSVLASGDIVASEDPDTPPTPPAKRLFFLQNFIPFLRKQLSTQSIVAAMSSASSIDNTIVAVLIQDVLKIDADIANGVAGTRALDAVESIRNDPSSTTSWNGHLFVNTTDKYTFYAKSVVDDSKPASITIDGVDYEFANQQEDPTNVWYGRPIQLMGGKLHPFVVRDQVATKLSWKTDLTVPTPIPPSALIPSHATSGVEKVITLLLKCAIFINGFSLTLDEVLDFQKNGPDFDNFDWNELSLAHWKRLNDYVSLKKSLPKSQTSLLQLFEWARAPSSRKEGIGLEVQKATQWLADDVNKLIVPKHFNLADPKYFRNEVSLIKIQEALSLAKTISVDIDKLFIWAKPTVSFSTLTTIANDIKTAIRTKYSLSDWEKAIKPTYDTLRQNQSNALVAYLVVQPALVKQGVIDADSLFEFFLIDPSMCPCMETSRLKQATSSVQLFIQRCLLGLEDQQRGFGQGVSLNLIDRDRWEWMQRYRLWEANRKVYLFPENWIQASLRDDKSPQFKALESELLQKDVTETTVLNAMKNYLFAVDEVANLRTVALYVEDMPEHSGKDNPLGNIKTVHFFGRPSAAPYKYYHRTFDAVYGTWTPWEIMQIDVPNYEIERKKSSEENLTGCYVVPFTYNGRLIVGLPQFMRKQVPQKMPDRSFSDMAQGDRPVQVSSLNPLEYWEIKFGYTELLNGVWRQKIVSGDAVWEAPTASLPEISEYQFVPEIQVPSSELNTVVYIDVVRNGTKVGRFTFNGSRVTKDSTDPPALVLTRVFQYTDDDSTHTVTSLQSLATQSTVLQYPEKPLVKYPVDRALESTVRFPRSVEEPFNHQFLHALISQASSAATLDQFFNYFQSDKIVKNEAWGSHLWKSSSKASYNELHRTYSLYNWEMAFHAPMLLADKLLETQQFDLALKMCHYVFNPFAKGSGVKRYWKMPPFQEIDSINSLDKLFSDLKPNHAVPTDDPVNQWRDKPFQPHVLARLRPVSYMKWTVMKYVEILIAYGDWYFQQNTLEMIPMAIQMYVLASHIYGLRGQKIPRRGKKRPETYLTLLNKWDAFGNAMVQLELDFPFSNQIGKSFGDSNGVRGLANIFGFATNRYFCIPNNDQLTALRDKIDDRLFKIRHCQDIKGVFRILPLYEPPLDVGQLVAATAAGLSLRSVLNDLNAPMPNFKFPILLAKALELCGELKALGGAFLSAKEKQDAEALSILRQRHDMGIQTLLMQQKKLALQEAQANLDALISSRAKPEYQLKHTLKLLGQDAGLVPTQEDDWQELKDDIAAPVQDSGLALSAEEKEEMDKASEAKDVNTGSSIIQAIGSDLKAFPTINGHASPFGVGVAGCWGPGFIGDVMNGMAQVIKIGADVLTHQSTNASRKNGHMRTNQDRTQTANNTGYELKNIDKQILASKLRIDMSNQEIANQQKQIDNSQELLDFFTNKYSNQELYSFMEGRVRTLYYQTYQMAYSWARKAEACFRFDRGLKDTNFIQPGYWEPGRDGLLAGEALFMSLKNLEAAYHEERGHDFEVSKMFSLRQNNPLALLQLRENAACEFAIPEILYDMDFPGHYLRKIKAVTLTMPCIIGPCTTVNCTLRLTSHKYRFDATARDKKDYVEKTPEQGGDAINGDPRFDTVLVPISAAAVSTASNDGGVFDLSFSNAERFLPFEGAGAISTWSLSLPSGFRQFDYSSIQDVVLHIRYTSRDGGAKLGDAAAGAVAEYIGAVKEIRDGLYAIVDARTEFAVQWAAFKRTVGPAPAPQQRVLLLEKINERLPIYTKGHAVAGLVAQGIWVITDAPIAASSLSLSQGNNSVSFSEGQTGAATKGLKTFVAKGPLVISDWKVICTDVGAPVSRLWVVIRYLMK